MPDSHRPGVVIIWMLVAFRWGMITLDHSGLTIRRVWGSEFYSWGQVEEVYTVKVYLSDETGPWISSLGLRLKLWRRLGEILYIALKTSRFGHELTRYPYQMGDSTELVNHLNRYRQDALKMM